MTADVIKLIARCANPLELWQTGDRVYVFTEYEAHYEAIVLCLREHRVDAT